MKNIELYYQLQVHEPSGLLVADTGIREGHSFTKQFAQILFNGFPFAMATASPEPMTNTSNTSKTVFVVDNTSGNPQGMVLLVNAATAESGYGIQVGTSTAAESISDYALGTQIAHGTSAGQLQHGTVTFAAPSTTATTTTFRITRVFTNGSGGTVTVQEIGLVSSGAGTAYRFLLIRDLTGAVAVNNGQQLTVNYDLTTTI